MVSARMFWCALSATALLLTGACMSDNGKNAPLPRLSKERAVQWAEQHASRMAEAAGVTLDKQKTKTFFNNCVGEHDEVADDGRYTMDYAAYANVPTERHTDVVRRIRADFEKEKYRITGYREYEDDYNSALVDAADDETGFTISAGSAGPAKKPSKLILFSVSTPCMIPPGVTQQPQ